MLEALFINCETSEKQELAQQWGSFLKDKNFDLSGLQKIDFSQDHPVVFDLNNNKFCIDFQNNKVNYHKKIFNEIGAHR